MDLDTIFETERLILRPLRLADVRDLHVYTGDPQAMRFMSSAVLSYEATLDGLKKNLETRFQEMIPLGYRAENSRWTSGHEDDNNSSNDQGR